MSNKKLFFYHFIFFLLLILNDDERESCINFRVNDQTINLKIFDEKMKMFFSLKISCGQTSNQCTLWFFSEEML